LSLEELDQIENEDEPSIQSLRELIVTNNLQHHLRDGPEVIELDVSDDFEVPRDPKRALERKRKSRPHPYWWNEVGNYNNKHYPRSVPPMTSRGERKVYIWYCDIPVPNTIDVGDGQIIISIDISLPATRHPRAYACDSTHEDLAHRLAFKVTGSSSHGIGFIYYPQRKGWKAVFKANSLVDILLNGTSPEALANTPRRYLNFSHKAPKGLEEFEGGKYTARFSESDAEAAIVIDDD